MEYFVIARRWNGKNDEAYIAGCFSDYANANLFCKAYNERYHAGAMIVKQEDLLNK